MMNVLVIEDDERLRETLSLLLRDKYCLKCASSVKEATDLAIKYQFDGVISDFILSDGNGFGVLKLINSLASRPKIFFMTAYAEKDMVVQLLNHKVDGLFEKPFDFASLLSVLDKELRHNKPELLAQIKLNPAEKNASFGTTCVPLTDVEFKIFGYLLIKSNVWVSRDDLIIHVWGHSVNSRNTLDTHLTNLKRKIPSFKDDLKVVRGRGYLYAPTL